MEKSLVQALAKFIGLLDSIDKRLKCLEYLETKRLEPKQQSRLIPLSKWNAYHDWPTIGALRHLAFYHLTNGANKFLRQSGRRLLIWEKSFFKWVNDGKD